MFKIIKMLTVFLLLSGAGLSSGAVIDFENVAPVGDVAGPFTSTSPHFEDGTALFGSTSDNLIFDSAILASDVNTNGSDIFGWCGDCSMEIALFADTIPAFNLLSIDATDLLFPPDVGTTPGNLHIEGGRFGSGSPVSVVLDLSAEWATYTLPETFTNLEGVIFRVEGVNARSLAIDNIVIEAVPVPAAFWLFGSGLVGLIGVARRKKS